MFRFTESIPLALYIHIPWCIRKCPYCDFNSHEKRGELPEADYINALIADLDEDLKNTQQRELISIFIGGGTPSLFSPEAIAKLLAAVQSRMNFSPNIEITLEANPGTIDLVRFAGFRRAGINRLSIGIQSLQNDKLKKLGRIHDAATAIQAVEAAHQAGFQNFNIDLMYGLPQQSLADALYDLETAIALRPTHLSWYQLTLEPNTPFHRTPPSLPGDETTWEMQEQGKALLARHQLQQYEVSAYGLAEHFSQHNMNYWQFGDYLGIGAGAHGKLTDVKTQTVTRYWKRKHPREYLMQDNTYLAGSQIISAENIPFEFMLNALRLYQTIPFKLFETRTGLPITIISTQLKIARAKELLTYDETSLTVTELGKRFLNDLVELFMV